MITRTRILPAPEDAVVGARVLRRLPAFFRQSTGAADARVVLRERLERREMDFLASVRHAVFGDQASPYQPLVRWAGCEYGDLVRLVERDGIEYALGALFRAGVYLTADELKGRRPTVRGRLAFTIDPDRLRNRALTSHLLGQSTGSDGPRTPVRIDLASVWDQAVDLRLYIEGRADTASVHAVWGVPGSWTMSLLLRVVGGGLIPARWFSQVDARAPGLHPRYRWSKAGRQARGIRPTPGTRGGKRVRAQDPARVVSRRQAPSKNDVAGHERMRGSWVAGRTRSARPSASCAGQPRTHRDRRCRGRFHHSLLA